MCPPSSDLAPGTANTSDPGPIPDCVPPDTLSQSAYTYAAQHLHPFILAHSVRVYLHAKAISTRENSLWTTNPDRLPLLFAASVLHDLGTTTAHDGPQRFEVEGADAAASLLRQHNVPEEDVHEVWVAIALHTSPGIAERITPLARLVRLGVAVDFKRPAAMVLTTLEEVAEVERLFPRGEIEKVLSDAVVEQAFRRPEKAPAPSWPGVLFRSAKENPGWTGVNKAF